MSVCVWRFNHLRGQTPIPWSYHTPPHTALLCVKQNPGLGPVQMAIIWWLTVLVFITLWGNGVFLSFIDDRMNYPVVFLCLSSSSSSPASLGLNLATHVRKCYGEERRTDHKCRKIGDIHLTWCPVTRLCRWVTSVIFLVCVKLGRSDQPLGCWLSLLYLHVSLKKILKSHILQFRLFKRCKMLNLV